METKFLSDGRKVVIVGALNNQETIVQEVFVTPQGDEIPGGERFVVKSLHDTPVETYLSREKKRYEVEIENAKFMLERVNKEIRDSRNKLSFWGDMLKSVKPFCEAIEKSDLHHFCGVLSGRFQYAVQDCYHIPKIESIEDCMSQIDKWRCNNKYEGIRLLSVLGNANGNLAYKVNQYSDGSGGSNTVHFFETQEDARKYVKTCALAYLEKYSLDSRDIKNLSDMGISFSSDEMEIIRKKLSAAMEKKIDSATKTFNAAKEEAEKEINLINQQISSM